MPEAVSCKPASHLALVQRCWIPVEGISAIIIGELRTRPGPDAHRLLQRTISLNVLKYVPWGREAIRHMFVREQVAETVLSYHVS